MRKDAWRLSRFWPRLDPVDKWLAALRAVALVGGMAWAMLHSLDHSFDRNAHRRVVWLFAAFAAYSLLLYLLNAVRPGRVAALYRAAMILDLVFIFALVRATGGMASSFYLAFYMLIALHAFYFGLATGAVAALLSSLLYAFTDSWPPPIGMSDLSLRVGFFLLVGLCMGGLAERERRERHLVEQLNTELQDKQRRLANAQDELIRSDRLATVGELAAGLAHDLRNPIAGVSGALHVLSGQLPDADPRQALLAEVQAQVARMNKTLSDLLWHARPPTPEYRQLGVNELVEQTLWFLPMVSGTRIEVITSLQPGLPPLRLDPSLFHQAVLNLLVNARQAMPDGGRVTITTRLRQHPDDEAELVEISISDTGPGIPEADLSRIFQPFFTTKAHGTGLGLAIAARIVKRHGGRIEAESELGRGATFRIAFPVPARVPSDPGVPPDADGRCATAPSPMEARATPRMR
jgi:signal transduction histidine kinase